jgi:hypothetical protein
MEETSGAVAEAPLKEAPFSELISLWLDEGERLSASAAAALAPKPATESRVRQVVESLRLIIERHRLFVFVGIGLLPLALILCIYRGAPAQAAASTIAAPPPVAAFPRAQSPTPSSAPAEAAPAPVPSSVPAQTSPIPAALASAGTADVKAAPHRHHHHHRRHAASAPSKTVAAAGRATRR